MAFCGFSELAGNTEALPAKTAGPPVTFQMSKGIKLDPPALPLARRPSDSTGALPVVSRQTGQCWVSGAVLSSGHLHALEGQLGLRVPSE